VDPFVQFVSDGVPSSLLRILYGPAVAGKTSLTLQVIAKAQASGGVVALVDAEHMDRIQKKLGVSVKEWQADLQKQV
jgi:recombination protein RecA